jgi:hypothetical protein
MNKLVKVLASAAMVAIVAALGIAFVPPQAAIAADGANFDAGMIISDETFYNSGAMNPGQVQAFLNEKGAGCSPNSLPCLKDILLTYPQRGGDQYCSTLPAAANQRAADLFAAIAVACGINPQVLLVLVEKEQSLVSRSSPSDYSYRYATGFACPDTGGCDDALSGFVTQVYLAAKQFERYRINPGSYNYQAGMNNNILFNPNPGCGSTSVFIRNQATAGLYNYTPYQPNAAALQNLYGSGDGCSSYGNRNFWRMFTDWFGSTSNTLTFPSFEGGTGSWQYVNGPLERQLVGPGTQAKSGQYFMAMYGWRSGLSISQDIGVAPQVHDSYTASVWVKSGSQGRNFNGTLAVWALGGQQEVGFSRFTVGEEWTQIFVTLPIQRSGHAALRVEVYLDSTDAVLWLDATDVRKATGQPQVGSAELSQGSFEGGIGSWGAKNGAIDMARYEFGTEAQDGGWVLAVNSAVSGRSIGQDVPVTAARAESFTASVWLRASDEAGTYSGDLALWGLGGDTSVAVTPFTVGPDWTQVTTTVTIGQETATSLRMEVYLGTATGDLYLDHANLLVNLLPNPSFEQGPSGWDAGLASSLVGWRSDGAVAVDGSSFGVTSAAFTSGSIATDVRRATAVGETYTASIWLRTEAAGTTWTGQLALWALGGAQELALMPVSVTETWTRFELQLPIAQASHSALRLELYTGSPGVRILLDGALLG